jgi:uncharacterized protein
VHVQSVDFLSVILRSLLNKISLLTCHNADVNANTRTLPQIYQQGMEKLHRELLLFQQQGLT